MNNETKKTNEEKRTPMLVVVKGWESYNEMSTLESFNKKEFIANIKMQTGLKRVSLNFLGLPEEVQ